MLVANDAVIRADLAETLAGAGYGVEGFTSHSAATNAVASGACPAAAIFDTPVDPLIWGGLERILLERGIPFLRLTSGAGETSGSGATAAVIEYPFSPLQILDGLRQHLDRGTRPD